MTDVPNSPVQEAAAPTPTTPVTTRRRSRLHWLWLPLILPLLIAGLLLGSSLGLKSALYYGLKSVPLLTVGDVEGGLLTGFTLRKLRYVTETDVLEIGAVSLNLSPGCLLKRNICIEKLAIEDVDFHAGPGGNNASFDFPAVVLPAVHLPFNVDIHDAQMNRLTLFSGDSQFDIRDAHLQLHTDNDTIFINDISTRLVFSGLTINAAIEGDLDLRGETAANLSTKVGLDFTADLPDLNIEADIHGSALAPDLSATTRGLVEAHTELKASFREKGWPVYARVKQNAPTKIDDSVPVTLSNTAAIISGYVNAYHVEGKTDVSGVPDTPEIHADIITDGDFFGLSHGNVDLAIGPQQANVKGEFTWYPRLYWNTGLVFDHLDAATWLEGATSELSGNAHVTGEWYPEIPFRNTVELREFKGEWRKHPVQASTTFTHTADTLDVDHLDAMLGSNKARAQGTIKQQWNMAGNFSLPALNEILPQLEGAIEGKFAINGERTKPAVDMTASSPQLRIYETRLEAVTAKLNGTPDQHQLTASARWQGYDAQASLAGQLEQAQWKGLVRTATIAREKETDDKGAHEIKSFALTSPAALAYSWGTQKLSLGNTCLASGTEQICSTTQWDFNRGNGTVSTELKNFQPGFISPLITDIESTPGIWSGKASASFQQFRPAQATWNLDLQGFSLKRVFDKTFTPSVTTRTLSLQGQLNKRKLSAQAQVQWPDQRATEASVDIADINQPDSLNFSLRTDPLPLLWGAPWINALQIRTGQVDGHVEGSLTKAWPELQGELRLSAGALNNAARTWGLDKLDAHLALNGTTTTLSGSTMDDRGMSWQLSTPLTARWSAEDRSVMLEQGCLSTGNSALCGKGQYTAEAGLDLNLDAHGNISPWLAPVVTDNALIDGPFEGHARLQHNNGNLSGDLKLHSTVTTTLPPGPDQTPPSVEVEINATLADHALNSTLSLRGAEDSRVEGQLRADLAGTHPIEGHIDVHGVTIAPLRPLIREVEQLSGELNGTFLISGTLGQPTLEGELQLSNGQLSSAVYPFAFSNITAQARFTQQTANLVAELESGKRGRATLTSQAQWQNGNVTTHSRFKGDQIPIKQGSNINLRTDADLTLDSTDGRIDLGGLIKVNEGFLRVAKLPENSTRVSKDTVYVDNRETQTTEKTVDANVNLAVQLSDMVKLDGFGAEVRMQGAVGIQQVPPNDPVGHGSLTITEGTYTGYGQKLKITKGQILFNGPLDSPVLAIKAIREATSADGAAVVAGINITGTPQQPESNLFSVPAMPEQDILSYIVLGRARDSNGSGSNFAMNQALLSVGLYGSEDFTRDLASKVGIDDFEISTSTDKLDHDSVNVGGYLSPKLFLQYGVGINTPVNTITLRYRLTQRIFLEALSGAESALDVLYSFELE